MGAPAKTRVCHRCHRVFPATLFIAKKPGRSYRPRCPECLARREDRGPNYSRQVFEYGIKKYGLTVEDWARMFHHQRGCCAACGESVVLHVDHCHVTGRVRGLLCRPCNNALGCVKDRVENLLMLVGYLEEF